MIWYCEKCKCTHNENELCPSIKRQLRDEPELLVQASNLTTIVGDYQLSTSQALDVVAKQVNRVCNTNFSYEGGRQTGRDIQVFKRIYDEKKLGKNVNSAETAKKYAEKATKNQLDNMNRQFTGYQNEVDWYLDMKGKVKSIILEPKLDTNNAPGKDGTVTNIITGKTTTITVKASADKGASTSTNIETNLRKVKDAIEKGKGGVDENTVIVGPKGTAEAAKKLGLNNPVQEVSDPTTIAEGNKRLLEKMLKGEGYTEPTLDVVKKTAAKGAVVGAAVGLTISTITSYVRYSNGELTIEETVSQISEDTIKSAICGAAVNSLVLFIPFGGVVGFALGALVGIYVSSTTTNILDEIYGKGAYKAIYNSAGYVYGTAMNLEEYYNQMIKNEKTTNDSLQEASALHEEVLSNFMLFYEIEGEY